MAQFGSSRRPPNRIFRKLASLGGMIGLVLLGVSVPVPVRADSLTGTIDDIYAWTDSNSTDPFTGNMTKTDSRSIIQLYSLALTKNLWPNFKVFASGTLQKTDGDTITNGERASSTTVLTRPFIDVSLGSFPFSIGANYGKTTTEQKSDTAAPVTLISETTTGILSWKPSELPSFDFRATSTKNYDKALLLFNTKTDYYSLTSVYQPVTPLQLRYYGNYIDSQDLLGGTETKTLGHDGKVDYTDRFFKDRVNFEASEEITTAAVTAQAASGQASISFQAFAIRGLQLNTTDVLGLSRVPLASAPFLIDGSFSGLRSDANNIGSSLFPTDTTPRNVGLQFAVPTEVSTLDVWVYSVHDTRFPDTTQDFLTAAVAGSFTWDVYTSTDNLSWTLFQASVPAVYTPFAGQLGVGKFEITFPNGAKVTAQYIKVVVSPLLPTAAGGTAANFPGVYLNELQAFDTANVSGSSEATQRSTARATNIVAKVKLLENPFLFYDFSYFAVQAETASVSTRNSTLSNGLSVNQQFNPALSGSASAQRIDTRTDNAAIGDTVQYQFYASLHAAPLRTLSHSLTLSDQTRDSQIGHSSSQSVYLTNNAELYKNVTVYLNGGQTWSIDEVRERSTQIQYAYGGSVIPVKTVTITGASSYTRFNANDTGFYTRNDNLSVSYYPLPAIYLTAAWNTVQDSSHTNRLKNYGANWSPFPGGSLLIGFTYMETLQTEDNSLVQSLTESVRWNINRRTALQLSYGNSKTSSDLERTKTRGFFAEFTTTL